ncbi:MAG: UvrD-helicase domain-containing protein [Spongiibacteraceae bacterium]|jgi:ATP-dependent exoDNAse (exonuclease V) beta subunit|nr:UvrD-helicase domain-containing protein [Spongiibacteraceae bacterium]
MSAPRLPADAAVRARVLDTRASFCVSAPAGSGKTELLTQRVLALLADVEQPEQLYAITFTRKAAAEMRQRVLAALQLAATEPEPAEPHRQQSWRLARAALANDAARGWQLLSFPARLRVLTIDGLCGALARQAPLSSGFGAQPGILDDASAAYRQAARLVLARLGLGSAEPALEQLYTHLDNNGERLEQLLISLLACRDQWLPLTGLLTRPEATREALHGLAGVVARDAVQRAHRALLPWLGELDQLGRFAGGNLLREGSDSAIATLAGGLPEPGAGLQQQVDAWQAVAELLLTNDNRFRRQLTKNHGFPAASDKSTPGAAERKAQMKALLESLADSDASAEALIALRVLPALQLADGQWQILQALLQTLRLAAAELQLVFAASGEVDHSEIAMAARRALGEPGAPSELLLRLDYQLRHILVDEFQDTSLAQFQLLERLVEGWAEHNAVHPQQPRTVFIVGDGMQSIYGFREAEVGLFVRAREQGINGLPLQDARLTTNFRSRPAVIDWVNRHFARVFPAQEDIASGAVRYEPSVAFNPPGDGEVSVEGVLDDPGHSLEAQWVTERVRAALARDAQGSVAVLVRNRSHLRQIVPALSHAGIAWRATDIDPLANRPVIGDLLSLLRVLLSPADRLAWLALLRSPLAGLDNRDLYVLMAPGPSGLVHPWSRLRDPLARRKLTSEGQMVAQRLSLVLEEAWRERGRRPLRDWLQACWIGLGGMRSEAEWRTAEPLLALVERETLRGGLDWQQLDTALVKLYAADPSAADTRVELLTIHKAKGLEFDTVIVPGLERRTRSDERPLLLWGEVLGEQGEAGLLLAAAPPRGTTEPDPSFEYLLRMRAQRNRLEQARLLYVAATRAGSHLHLFFGAERDAQGEPRTPGGQTLLAQLWPALEAEAIQWREPPPVAQSQISLSFDAPPEPEDVPLARLPGDWQPPGTVGSAIASEAGHRSGAAKQPLPDIGLEATAVGNAVHALLEQLARHGEAAWRAHPVDRQRALAGQYLQASGAEAPALADRVLALVARALDDPQGRWLLFGDHREAQVEWP